MIVFSLPGRGFTSAMAYSSAPAYWGAKTYLGRTCVGLSAKLTVTADFRIAPQDANCHVIPITASAATDPVGIKVRLGIGFSELALSDGDSLEHARLVCYGLSGAGSETIYFRVARAGSTYSLTMTDGYGSSSLISGIAAGAWYRAGCDIFTDKTRPWAAGAYLADIAASRAYVNRIGTLTLSGNTKFWPYWDDVIVYQGNTGGTAGLVTMNNAPLDGENLYIKKAYVSAGVSSGDVSRVTVADGVEAARPSSDGDWLVVGTYENNSVGAALRRNRAGGAWTDSDWSL